MSMKPPTAVRSRLARPFVLLCCLSVVLGALAAEPGKDKDKDKDKDKGGAVSPTAPTHPAPQDRPAASPARPAAPKPTPKATRAGEAPTISPRVADETGTERGGAKASGEGGPLVIFGARLESLDIPGNYRARMPEILAIMEPVLGVGIPAEILERRVREAALKGVNPDRALEAFARDADDLLFLARKAREARWPLGDEQAAFYDEAASAMRSGIGRPALDCLFHLAQVSKVDTQKAGSALTTLAALRKAFPIDDYEAAALAGALAASALTAKQMPGILDEARRWVAEGGGAEAFRERLLQALRDGASWSELRRSLRP